VTEGDHYFSTTPAGPAHARTATFDVAGHSFELATAGGVFSADRLDPGTAVLLRKAELPGAHETGPLLDLGCGYGAITCVLGVLAPAALIYAVDVNSRARELAVANAETIGAAARVTVAAPEGVPAQVRFRQIWSNPPIRIGKAELHELLDEWLPRLTPDGVAWLVVSRHLGSDSLATWLSERGWQVLRHASQRGYRVLRVTR
jgi:16S rRNA G1207 methylase RsmC